MLPDRPTRAELIDTIRMRAGRDLGNWSVLFAEAAAEQTGLYATDLRYLDLAGQEPNITAGRLAELTGLTTGAVTGVLDRLERAGFLWREKDPADRRRVFIRLAPARLREVGEVFASSQRAWAALCERYTDEQLVSIIDFMIRGAAILQQETEQLRLRTKAVAKRARTRPVAPDA